MIINITKNGEIDYNQETRLYRIWDETYCDTICETYSEEAAFSALEKYSEYLDSQ